MDIIDEPMLLLWTWQLPDWDITSQRRDSTYMEFAWGAETAAMLQPLYDRLYEELGTRDFVWCATHYDHWGQLEVRRLWCLKVPLRAVLRYTDSPIWKCIVGIAGKNPGSAVKTQYWRRLFIAEDEALASIKQGRPERVGVLLSVPIQPAWVIDRARFNKGAVFAETPYCELPTSEEEARACGENRI